MIKLKAKLQILNIIKHCQLEGWSNIHVGDIIELILPSTQNNIQIKNITSTQSWETPFNIINDILSNNFVINQIK